jgi:hypothetical protein
MHGQHICQTGFAYRRDERDYALTHRLHEVDTLMGARQCPDCWEDISVLSTHPPSDLHSRHVAPLFDVRRRVPRGRRLRERVERPEHLPAAIERSLKVMRREKRHTLLNVICGVYAETNLLGPSAPA